MKRLPLLIIAIFLLVLAGVVILLGVSFMTASIQQQQEYAVKMMALIPFAATGGMVLGFVIWVWALVHMLTNRAIHGADRIVWVLVIILLNVLGAILYFLLSPSARSQDSHSAQASKQP